MVDVAIDRRSDSDERMNVERLQQALRSETLAIIETEGDGGTRMKKSLQTLLICDHLIGHDVRRKNLRKIVDHPQGSYLGSQAVDEA
jgi:hypothetical protein